MADRINSRDKGARGERLFSKVLIGHGVEARRGQQYHGGEDSPDIICDIPWAHFEVKFTERFSLYEALAQAISDAPETKIPIVAHKRKRKEWVVVMRMEDFMKFRLKLEYLKGGIMK